jgi:hypothetical protein
MYLIKMLDFKVGNVVIVTCSKELNKSGKQEVKVVEMFDNEIFNGSIGKKRKSPYINNRIDIWTFANEEVIKVLKSGFVFR